LAEIGHLVTCVDCNKERIKSLKKGVLPIYEPNLEEIIKRNIKNERLFFIDNLSVAVSKSQLTFISVGTPSKKDGSVDLSYVDTVVRELSSRGNKRFKFYPYKCGASRKFTRRPKDKTQ
jgi:UDPglucose 6-dehydrogenase